MSEERSCEEAATNAWYRWAQRHYGNGPISEQVAYEDGFIAGAAWARTPTLPAGAHEVVQVDEVTFRVNGHTFRVPRTPLMPIRAAGDRPPAEREAGVREATELAEAVAGRKFDPPAVISSTSTNREPVETPAPKEGT